MENNSDRIPELSGIGTCHRAKRGRFAMLYYFFLEEAIVSGSRATGKRGERVQGGLHAKKAISKSREEIKKKHKKKNHENFSAGRETR